MGQTYVERPFEENPAGLGLNIEVLEVVPLEGRGEAVPDGTVVVRVLVRRGNAQDVGADVCVLQML